MFLIINRNRHNVLEYSLLGNILKFKKKLFKLKKKKVLHVSARGQVLLLNGKNTAMNRICFGPCTVLELEGAGLVGKLSQWCFSRAKLEMIQSLLLMSKQAQATLAFRSLSSVVLTMNCSANQLNRLTM